MPLKSCTSSEAVRQRRTVFRLGQRLQVQRGRIGSSDLMFQHSSARLAAGRTRKAPRHWMVTNPGDGPGSTPLRCRPVDAARRHWLRWIAPRRFLKVLTPRQTAAANNASDAILRIHMALLFWSWVRTGSATARPSRSTSPSPLLPQQTACLSGRRPQVCSQCHPDVPAPTHRPGAGSTASSPGPAHAGAEDRGLRPPLHGPEGSRQGLKEHREPPTCTEDTHDGPEPKECRQVPGYSTRIARPSPLAVRRPSAPANGIHRCCNTCRNTGTTWSAASGIRYPHRQLPVSNDHHPSPGPMYRTCPREGMPTPGPDPIQQNPDLADLTRIGYTAIIPTTTEQLPHPEKWRESAL